MRLIHCYIENFGGLHQYSLDFNTGLTTICADNGFGKTTLTVFLRTMFYGFPRAGKTLDKNDRKKYLPWQGGKYGGNLTFAHEGVTYRIERTFGATPRQDTFALYELDPLRKSTRFSENIGLELFGLDLDSFERSTYLPQNHSFSSLTTDSIQAKLGDLVEDTSDVGNFDKAMQTLRSKRSSYLPYRGNGGLVNEAIGEISRLQTELNESEQHRIALEAARIQVGHLQAACDETQAELTAVRERLTAASEATAKQALRQQYDELRLRQKQTELATAELQRKYPAGLPSEEAMQEISDLLDRLAGLQGSQTSTEAELEAAARIQRDKARFSRGIPTESEFTACEGKCRTARSLQGELKQSHFAEQNRLDALEDFFAPGIPTEETIDGWQSRLEEKNRLQAQLDAVSLPAEAEQSEIPDEEILQAKQADLARAEMLRREIEQLEVRIPTTKAKPLISPVPFLLIGLLLLLGGTGLLIARLFLPGGLALGFGVVLLVGGVYLQLHRVITTELQNSTGTQTQLDAKRQELAHLEQELAAFFARYSVDATDPQAALTEIRRQAAISQNLHQQAAAMEERRQELCKQIAVLTLELEQALLPYFRNHDAIPVAEFRAMRKQLLHLRQQKAESDARQTALRQELLELGAEISDFLRPYCTEDRDPEELLTELRRDCDAYRQAEQLLTAKAAQDKTRQAEQADLKSRLRNFFQACGMETADRTALQTLRDDRADLLRLTEQKTELDDQLARFCAEHGEIPQTAMTQTEDAEALKAEELGLTEELNRLSRELAESRQNLRQIRRRVDQIPDKEDALAHWQEEKRQRQQNSALLDTTMDFLQQAREQLSSRYMAPIQRSFTDYMERLWGDDVGRLLLDTELNVCLERSGEARELGYFSTGSADIVTLCMRFSLVDALFRETEPFLILDDPFVNLDDRHTETALNLLKELSEHHQILYLTCNSSRIVSR